MARGESEGLLTLHISPPEAEALSNIELLFIGDDGKASSDARTAALDGYKRLLALALETETRRELKERTDVAAIQVFAYNLSQLPLAPPLGQKNVLALDPGFRTGCKVVCLDRQGQLIQ